ncbi:hypothetical protein KP509_19G016800 [Ceratopteris richardii]|uniref:YTH domain-containing protein n=1 Tax=Ceratopteris richardii TaxID=49495 RepID=A0A8T2SLF4_CERRI|nr:hypothetical protein KP509_19G016800 [Ceratopteris richardii]
MLRDSCMQIASTSLPQRTREQCDTGVEENLQRKILDPQVSSDASHDLGQKKNLKIVADQELGDEPREKQGQLKTMTHSIPKEGSYIPVSIKNNKACKPNAVYSKRFFIIKSLNYHNLEKSVEKGIWATQAMNERILNEAFETAEKVLLIFSVNMSGHFQGYAQMTSPIGRRKVNVWSEANWGGTFTVEWIRLYDLPFQKTLHLKNPLNSFKPVKISRDCQELTTEIGEALCALIDGGADSEFSKRRIHVRSDYFMKKPCMERPFHESAGYLSVPLQGHMQSMTYPPSLLPQVPGGFPAIKYTGGSSSRSIMHLPGALNLSQQEDKEASGQEISQEDLLNMSYEEYLQFRKNLRESKYKQQVLAGSQVPVQQLRWSGKEDVDNCQEDAYATYLANWYASQQSSMMQSGCYPAGSPAASMMQKSSKPP